MTSDSLPVLAPELLAIIFGHLFDYKSVLTEVCLACRKFYDLATPILYRDFRQDEVMPNDRNRRLFSFVRTVLARPDLARHVIQVALEYLERDSNEFSVGIGERDSAYDFEKQIDVVLSVLFQGSQDYLRPRWKADCRAGSIEAILTLLLCSLPHVQTLVFTEGRGADISFDLLLCAAFEHRMARANEKPAPQIPFSNLCCVRMICDDLGYSHQPFWGSRYFFDLPNIRDVEICQGVPAWANEDDGPRRWDVEPRSSSVEKLSLQACTMTGACITTIIGSCAHLKEFHFTYGRTSMLKDDFTPLELLRGLAGHADTLEVLHVNYDDDFPKPSWRFTSPRRLRFNGQLRALSKLRKIDVTFSTLFGVSIDHSKAGRKYTRSPARREPLGVSLTDVLPDSLEELVIVTCDERVVDPVQILSWSRQGGYFQKLRRIFCAFADEQTKHSLALGTEMASFDIQYKLEGLQERQCRLDRQDRSEIFDDYMMM